LKIETVGVVGSGLMGRGIAQVAAQGGFRTLLHDVSREALDRALEVVRKDLGGAVERGKLEAGAAETALSLIHAETDFDSLAGADFVVEAVPEQIATKLEVFGRLDAACRAGTVLATNTSALSVTEIAAATRRPERVVGMHFFNPVPRMRLVEVIRALETSEEALQTTEWVASRMGKETVRVRESPGFVTSRINALIGNEAFLMLQEGVASAEDIDKALKLGLNHPMGPFEMVDLVGLDTRLAVLEYLQRSYGSRFQPAPLLVQHVKAGRLGRKVGRGVYVYEKRT
jgi:3-hydroxybutyryl-CoA dehydrogenase